MSAVLIAPTTGDAAETAVIRSWKAPVTLAIFTVLLGLLFVWAPREGATTFRLSAPGDAIQLPEIVAPVGPVVWTSFVVLALLSAAAFLLVRGYRKVPLWLLALFIIVAVVAFLTWAAVGAAIPVTGLLAGTLTLAVPLIYGALGGVIGERAGIVNIAIEGQLLAGAFTAAVVASITRQPILGLFAAMIAGALVAAVLAAFA
ncbi:MAG: ABC transporter permease, partial [Microterricola sp.]